MDQLDNQIADLERQLREVASASSFFDSDVGRIWTQLATAEITRITREITSEKYRKDHVGYNLALSDLMAYKNILKKMQLAASPVRADKINEKLETLENGE
jgi:hypothetical protein